MTFLSENMHYILNAIFYIMLLIIIILYVKFSTKTREYPVKDKIVIICGKSCSGKDTLLNYMVALNDYTPIISTTTRPVRDGEIDGTDYHYITDEEFKCKIKNDEFIEYSLHKAIIDGEEKTLYYGVEKSEIELEKGKKFAVVLDVVGIKKFIKEFGRDNIEVVYLDVNETIRQMRCIRRGDYNYDEWLEREKWGDAEFRRIKRLADKTLDINDEHSFSSNHLFTENLLCQFDKYDKKVIAVDFDNTIFITKYPTIKTPIWNVIEFLKILRKRGNTLILWTCRSGKELEDAVSACNNVGLEFDYINENCDERLAQYGNNTRKISADIYIDDKSLSPLYFLGILEKIF